MIAFTPTRDAAIAAAMQVPGWLSEAEAGLLFDLARAARGQIIEIGSFQGRSTIALALGALSGQRHKVYSIDNFVGCGDTMTSERQLNANLRKAGVADCVEVVACRSSIAIADLPRNGIDLVFIDGDHAASAVKLDTETYRHVIGIGGRLAWHDVGKEPGVTAAYETLLSAHAHEWLAAESADTIRVALRRNDQPKRIALAVPGPTADSDVVWAIHQATRLHRIIPVRSRFGWDDFQKCLAEALNLYECGEATHFAMIHGDVIPAGGWLDRLSHEMSCTRADVISAVCAIKDARGVTSTGIGDYSMRWGAWRRLTVRDVLALPETFSLADTIYRDDRDKYLLVNTGCWLADLRGEAIRRTTEDGDLAASFEFRTRIARDASGRWEAQRESEDWYWSRRLAENGARIFATRAVKTCHRGMVDFANDYAWGLYCEGDRDTESNWNANAGAGGTRGR